jgi:DMSO/TMAO reductase YedYZ molybdopterin-dependent catalytic subunit
MESDHDESDHDESDHDAPQQARAPRLAVISEEPLNAETLLARHMGVITPNAAFYVRNHFAVPDCEIAEWRLTIAGAVETPVELTYEELRALPNRTLQITLECAGNGRMALRPQAEGEPWGYGAVSTAEWTGVSLRTVLEQAGLSSAAREIVVEGADRGYVAAADEVIPFARSLPRDQAMHPDSLLAYAMNGEVLPLEHGFPVRLVIPGWYGMAAVKWVARIEAIAHRFSGFYQAERYIMARPEQGETDPTPLTKITIRSLITTPEDGATAPRGRHGAAWAPHAARAGLVGRCAGEPGRGQRRRWRDLESRYMDQRASSLCVAILGLRLARRAPRRGGHTIPGDRRGREHAAH